MAFPFWGKMQNWSVEILGCRTRNSNDFWNRKIEHLGKSSALMTHIWQSSVYKLYLMSWDWVMSSVISANKREKRTKYRSFGHSHVKRSGKRKRREKWVTDIHDNTLALRLWGRSRKTTKTLANARVGPGRARWTRSDFWWSSGNLSLIKECLGDN